MGNFRTTSDVGQGGVQWPLHYGSHADFPHHDNLYGKAYAIGYIRALIQTVYGG